MSKIKTMPTAPRFAALLCAASLCTHCMGILPKGDAPGAPTSSTMPTMPTSGGDSNATPSPTGSPNTPVNPSPTGSPNLLTQLDFEDGTTGDWQLVAGNGNAKVVDGAATAAHGTHALQLVAGSNYNDAAFLVNTKLFPLTPNQFYVRFYINLANLLPDGHTTFAVASAADASTEVRMGGQFSILVANIASTDGQRISADSYNGFPNGVSLKTGQWYCMELLYDGQAEAMHTYLQGTEVANLAVTKPTDWNSAPSAQWMPTFTQLKLGWQSYGAGTGNTVLLDDIAVSHTRIGCL